MSRHLARKRRTMAMKYFYWQRSFSGKWTPVASADMPSDKRAEGKNPFPFAGVITLSAEDNGLTLAELAAKYPPPQ
jgi:uncharacterized protein YbjT (DUF2867 family)